VTRHGGRRQSPAPIELVDPLLAVEDIVVLLTVQAIDIGSSEELVRAVVESADRVPVLWDGVPP
jgi:hypothetical protein